MPAGSEVKKEIGALQSLKLEIKDFQQLRSAESDLSDHVKTLTGAFTKLEPK